MAAIKKISNNKFCFRDECGSELKGICPSLDPVDGAKLLEYLRHVNFTGCCSLILVLCFLLIFMVVVILINQY